MQKIKNWIATALLLTGTVSLYAQETVPDTISVPIDSLIEEELGYYKAINRAGGLRSLIDALL